MLKQTSMQRFFGQAYAYPCQINVCSILQTSTGVNVDTISFTYNPATPCSMVYQVERVQMVVDQVAGVQVLDQVAGVQVVVNQVVGPQVVDQVAGTQVVDQVAGTQVVDQVTGVQVVLG